MDASPAEKYAAFKRDKDYPVYRDFAALYDFGLDDFQIRACREIEDGKGVLVAAPTGSGKTIVGEFAIHLALATGRKAFYTTPIKALSNQKYNDLVRRYGSDQVGLLTGDNVVNGEAPIVVMTTEVLRNMLYAGSQTLMGLGFVVMDEVHYLADRSRGAVWEEVIIHLPESVAVVSLSATVSNAEEFGEWLTTVRGETTTIIEEKRPVPLYQHVMAGRRIMDLFASSDVDAAAGFVKEGAPVNGELMRLARDDWAAGRIKDRRTPKDRRKGNGNRRVGNGRRVWIPSRVEVINALQRDNLLPAINFVFSRVGCDAAVQQCIQANLRLTTPDERDEIFAYVEEACSDLPDEDRHVLGYHDWIDGLSRGVAAHHAGLLPAFKQVVEELFLRGLVKAVFATETLALGINMPARTVVIEKLSKWNGEAHVNLSPGEYTQLVGRAGRRGLDVEGHGVVLWQQGLNPRELAGLASTRTYPLRSSFRPSYNMAVNLVHQFGRARSRELLEQSFAQFQADKAVVGLARQVRKAEDALDGYQEAATCDRGDFMEYAAIRRKISDIEKSSSRERRADRREEIIESLSKLKIGDVIDVPTGKFAGYAVVIDPGFDPDGPRPYVLTQDRQARRLAMMDFNVPIVAQTRLRVPKSFNGRNPQMRRDMASRLREKTRDLRPVPYEGSPKARKERKSSAETQISELRRELKVHPCHDCPDREDHARWAERWFKLSRDTDALRRRVEARTNTVARTFDRVCDVLTALDYLDGETVTERGTHLMRLYSEMDLVAAEALREGLWDDLTPSELAAALSVLVYEARRADDATPPRLPGGRVKDVIAETVRLWGQLDALERDHKLDFLRQPDLGFAWAAYRWAEGDELDDVLNEVELAAGDFVRWVKQLIDLCGQVADAAGDVPLRRTARQTMDLIKRGVVAYSSVVE
ncbi:ATP-dependent RNA helicase HelY [Nocardioides luteus]|uniref:Helicase n=1 Tax=Nocardioides luteus TaxID=1844 RepID=A0ABQ5T111_9ACTN|nr:DEAD/DEAH box helicase [Nocardioides luteus]MDR7310798.1 ATP-dependent RNA helicase HelY [Nocardioides luteus]GGR40577.1 helicase [Nocardioides luteus]GLJ69422.1 helicase [Nocardioides luteus]